MDKDDFELGELPELATDAPVLGEPPLGDGTAGAPSFRAVHLSLGPQDLEPHDDDRCLPLGELLSALQGDPSPVFWQHLRRCPRCTNAAVTLDPDVMLTEHDDFAKQASVIDPALYRDKLPFKRGGMYQTWTAVDRRLGRRVVIKGLPSELDEPDLQKRQLLQACLRREARILAQLSHPAIVTLLEAGEWRDGDSFYALELVEGETLSEAIKKRATLQSRLELLPAFANIVDAVAYAHRNGIVHRDLSPHNIIVGNGSATLIDWTTAKRTRPEHGREAILDAAEMPHEGTLTLASWGTPGFAPPEQREIEGHDHRVDIFTLGATLHFLITGQRPFDGDNVDEILDNVLRGKRVRLEDCPPPLASIIDKAMSQKPEMRYATADALAEDLRRFQSEQLVLAHEYSSLERFAHSHWFKPTLAILGGLVFASVSALMVMSFEKREERLRAEAARRIDAIETTTQAEKQALRNSLDEVSAEASSQIRQALGEKDKAEAAKARADIDRASAMQSATLALEAALKADETRLQAEARADLAQDEQQKLQKRLDEALLRVLDKEARIAALQEQLSALKEERRQLIASNEATQETLARFQRTIDAMNAAVASLQKTKKAEPKAHPAAKDDEDQP